VTTLQANPTHGAANPEFPSLSEDALGALKLAWRWVNVQDDWSKDGEVAENWDRWTGWPYMAKLTYDLTYIVRLAGKIAQEIPAWREVCGEIAEKCVDRMFQYASWCDWVEQPGLDPNVGRYPALYYKHTIPRGYAGVMNAPGYAGNGVSTAMDGLAQSFGWAPTTGFQNLPGRLGGSNRTPYFPQHSPAVGRVFDPDPVYGNGSSNMMYKGYALEQFALLKSISGSTKFDGKQRLVYDDEIQYEYSFDDFARILSEQMATPFDSNGSPLAFGVDCEVGKAFPACISVGGIGTELWDRIHGTDYVGSYLSWLEFGHNWIAGGADPNGPVDWCVPYYARDILYNMDLPEQSVPLFWTATAYQISVHDRPFAERIYEGAIKKYGRYHEDGALQLCIGPEFVGPLVLSDLWAECAALACAHEFGDTERHEALKLHMDKNYAMTRQDGESFYTFGLDEPWPRGIPNHIVSWTWAGGPGSLKRLYTEPNLDKFLQPTVEGVDYPTLTLQQAHVDSGGVLHIATAAGSPAAEGQATRFRVTQLVDRERSVTCNGAPCGDWTTISPTEIEIATTASSAYFTVR
jgi:hypothetical protein